MQPLIDTIQLADQGVLHTTTLEALIPQVIAVDKVLPVVDDAGEVIGVLDRRTVLLAMTES